MRVAPRAARRAAAHQRAARRREREGLDARLAMLAMQRNTILHGDDEFALAAEYDALLAAGVEPAGADDPPSLRALDAERSELDARAREAERLVANLEGELRGAEENVADVAALDEALAATRFEIAGLEAFERAIKLAREKIEARKEEAHRAFARRLEEYSAPLLATITARTLIVHGDRDLLYPVELAMEMYRAIPGSALWVVPNGGHGPIFGPLAAPFVANAMAHLGAAESV